MSVVQIFHPCLLLSSSTGYQIFKHGFQISKHVRACRHVKIGPGISEWKCVIIMKSMSICPCLQPVVCWCFLYRRSVDRFLAVWPTSRWLWWTFKPSPLRRSAYLKNNIAIYFAPVRRRGAEYCDERVCLPVCVCLSAIISSELHVRSSPNFCACYLWPWLGSWLPPFCKQHQKVAAKKNIFL